MSRFPQHSAYGQLMRTARPTHATTTPHPWGHAGERRQTGVRAESLRAMNLSLVLRRVLADPGGGSRAAIATSTGITRATSSRLVDELVQAGLVTELSPEPDAGRGRPAVRLTPRRGRFVALGLEVNVGSLSARAIDLTGAVLAEEVVVADFSGTRPEATIGALSALAHRVLEAAMRSRTTFLGSGLALPGLVSPDSLALAPNLGWRDIPLDELLTPIADLDPVLVANEADLAAFAVAHPLPGVPSGPSSFVLVSGEVGIGAGIVIDHRMLTGAHGWSGEIGHICVDPAGPVCSCGATGCLESYLGRRAFIRRAGLPAESGPADVVRAAREGSAEARRALDEGGAALGRALAAVINTVDIPLVVLGGNVAEVGEELLPAARREMSVRVLQSEWSQPEVRLAADSSRLAATGAAHRVLQRLVDDPLAWTA